MLLLDDRQPEWQKDALRDAGLDVKVVRLPAGDLLWTSSIGTVGIEDKPLTALLNDHRTGVLDDELRRLCESVAVPCLLVRGWPFVDHQGKLRFASAFDQDRFDGWTQIAYDNLLLGRQLRGVLVLHCRGKQDFGLRIAALHAYLERSDIGSLRERPRQYMPWNQPFTGKEAIVYTVLEQVKGLRNRRELTKKLAELPLGQWLEWGEREFRAFGFTRLMAERMAKLMEELRA